MLSILAEDPAEAQRYADLAKDALLMGLPASFGGASNGLSEIRDRDTLSRYAIYGAAEDLRLGPSLAWTALAYDLCYDLWDPTFRQQIAEYLIEYEGPMPDNRNGKTFRETGEWPTTTLRNIAIIRSYIRAPTTGVR